VEYLSIQRGTLGNKLTAYNPEKDEFIFIKSEKVYFTFED
jgi:hypothetical protein